MDGIRKWLGFATDVVTWLVWLAGIAGGIFLAGSSLDIALPQISLHLPEIRLPSIETLPLVYRAFFYGFAVLFFMRVIFRTVFGWLSRNGLAFVSINSLGFPIRLFLLVVFFATFVSAPNEMVRIFNLHSAGMLIHRAALYWAVVVGFAYILDSRTYYSKRLANRGIFDDIPVFEAHSRFAPTLRFDLDPDAYAKTYRSVSAWIFIATFFTLNQLTAPGVLVPEPWTDYVRDLPILGPSAPPAGY